MDSSSDSKLYCPSVTSYNEIEGKHLLPIMSLPDLSLGTKSLQQHCNQVQQQQDSAHQIQQEQLNQDHVQNSNNIQHHNHSHKVSYQQFFETHDLKEQNDLEKGQNCALEIFTSISQHVNNAAVDFHVARKDKVNSRIQDTLPFNCDDEYTSTVQTSLEENVCQSGMFSQNVPNLQVPLSARKGSQILDEKGHQNCSYIDENKKLSQPDISNNMLTANHSTSTELYHNVNIKTDSKMPTVKETSSPFLTSKEVENNQAERVKVDFVDNKTIESQEGAHENIQKNLKGDYDQADSERNGDSIAETAFIETEYQDYKCLCKVDFINHAHSKVKKYICGSCSSKFISICLLHHHLELHGSGGSYHFDHNSHTAFPKYDTFCSFTQTENTGYGRQDESTEDVNNSDETKVTKSIFKRTGNLLSTKIETQQLKSSVQQRNRRKQVNPKPIKLRISHQNTDDRHRKSRRKIQRKDKVNTEVNIGKKQSSDGLQVLQIVETKREVEKREKKGNVYVRNDNSNDDENIRVLKPFKKRGRPRKSENVNDTANVKKKRMMKKDKKDGSRNMIKVDKIDNSDESNKSEVIDNDYDATNETEAKEQQADDTINTKVSSDLEVKQKVRKNAGKFEMCDVCGLPVPKYNYVYHMRRHTGEKPYVCDKCGKAFAHRRFLVKHMLIHVEDKPWKCNLCSAQFCQKTEYSMHMNAHQGNRPYECRVCGMKFLSKGMLNTHQANVHMGITRFECEVCNRRFFKRSSLNVHQATHYEATMQCHYCDRMFKDKAGLKRHERIHTGEKRFRCHICNHEFIQSTPYWVHMEKRHQMDRESVKNMLKDIRESNKRYGIRTEINVLPKDVDHLLVTQENNDTNRSKTTKSEKKNASGKSEGTLKSSQGIEMINSYTPSTPFQQLKSGDNAINVGPLKSYTNIKVPNLNTSNVSVVTSTNTYSSIGNNEAFSLQPHFRYFDSNQEPVTIQTFDCGPSSSSLQEVTSAHSQSLCLPANIPVPVSLHMNSMNPLHQALDISSSLPPSTGSYINIGHQE